MRTISKCVGLVISIAACVTLGAVDASITEELIFERSPYVEAAQAAARGDEPTLRRLAKQGVHPDHEGRETRTPWGRDTVTLLQWAVLSDSDRGAETLLSLGANPNKASQLGITALLIAAGSRNDLLVELLLRRGANPNTVGQRHSPLTMALAERRNLGEKRFDRADFLLRNGADINLDLDRGETAVIHFAMLGDWRAVHWLVDRGANIESRDTVNATLMCYLRNSYRANTLGPSEAYEYRDRVRESLLVKGVAGARVDPALHPSAKCDD